MAPDQRAAQAGFTLLEVMVALVIAALASLVLYQAGFSGAAGAATAARYQQAIARAQSRLSSVGPLTALQPGEWRGDDGGGFTWQLVITPKASNCRLTLYAVQGSERFGGRAVTLATTRLGETP